MGKQPIKRKLVWKGCGCLVIGAALFYFTGYPSNAQSKSAKDMSPSSVRDTGKVYTFVEQMPQFPGGEAALMKYLTEHVHYPAEAKEHHISGTVVVRFVVDANGQINGIKTVGIKKGGGLEEEAIGAVRAMPQWTPGKQDGRKVTVQYSLPIRFASNEAEGVPFKVTPPPPPPPAP